MELLVVDNYEALSIAGADLFVEAIAQKPDAAVVLPTGNTPVGFYRDLAIRRERGELDLTRLRVFQLDEYLGVAPGDHRSLYGWMARAFLDPLGVPEANVVRLRGDAPDPEAECREYERAVREAGGYDLAVLGLGPNGHIGFNEPPADERTPTRVVELTEESVESNASYWGGRDAVPRRAMTAGMDLLLGARRKLLLVSGEGKREILRRTVEGPVTPEVPSSHLQRASGVTVLADLAARPDAR
jgi:glucosamine-6-phosphate deaminase